MEEFVSCALPNIGSEKVEELAKKLEEIGVLSFEDLKYVEEKDITDVLPPIQLKFFLDQFEDNASVTNECIKFDEKPDKEWAKYFKVPFDSFPKEIQEAAEKGQQPSKMIINDMVRTVVTHICNVDDTPGRKNLRITSSKIIDKFLNVFQDRFGDQIIGDGLTTLMKKLELLG
ncbi:hypothetical protein JTE90_027364 [Oedothorax gibbosus]|uniref:Uncharacterized protein n=1 Tax=Oedothorax gibbosus TaxID=931172 RepID=A0AAV6VZ32_9ARAC|nr:hypothetical protein JTE90_027364 [Oedothorax gibbosus]